MQANWPCPSRDSVHGAFDSRKTTESFCQFLFTGKVRTREVIELIQLGSKRSTWVLHLSGGQRQRLALGIAILPIPQILILDEPTTGLDPNARRELWKILESFKATGTTIILTTHYMEEAEYLCKRILMMDQGKILAEGSLSHLLDKFGEGDLIEYVIEGAFLTEKAEHLSGVLSCRWDENTGEGRLTVKNISETLPLFLQLVEKSSISLTSLECRRRTLDDLFLAMSGRHLDD